MNSPLMPWDRQPAETGPAYAAFLAYRDMGPNRTIAEAYKRHQAATPPHKLKRPRNPDGPTMAPGGWKRWSMDNKWPARVSAWDAHVEKARQEAALETARKSATIIDAQWEVNRLQQRQAEWQLREELIDKARAMLKFPLATKEHKIEGEGADMRHITIIKPGKWSFMTVVEMLKLATDLGRLACNMKPKPEDAAPSMQDTMFESIGEMEAALPGGAAPVMPEDVFAKPDLGSAANTANPHGLIQPKHNRP